MDKGEVIIKEQDFSPINRESKSKNQEYERVK